MNKPGVILVNMGDVPCISKARRRNGYVYRTAQGYFLYMKKRWHKMVFDTKNAGFDPITGKIVIPYKWED